MLIVKVLDDPGDIQKIRFDSVQWLLVRFQISSRQLCGRAIRPFVD